jgi:hypothetical protein
MPVEEARIRVVENRRLDAAGHQRFRVPHEELIECVLARDEDSQALRSPAGSSPLLPETCHGAGEADRERAVQKPDVDPELECVRGRHAE